MSETIISPRAYTKMILHAAKYPYCAVNGVLLSSKDSKSKNLEIIDAIPLFHICLHVTPMAEISLMQIEAMAAEDGLQISGYYAAAEIFYDNSIEKAPGAKIADKIADNSNNACFFIIDNKHIASTDKPALLHWSYTDNKWVKGNFSLSQCSITLDAVAALLTRGAMKNVFDFDNYLDDLVSDWANVHLNKDLKQILAMY